LVDVLHAAHDPAALSDLPHRRAAGDVIQPQMIPAVALAHPQQLLPFGQPVAPGLVRVVDEGFALFFDHHPRRARAGVYGDDPVQLVPTLLVIVVAYAAVVGSADAQPPRLIECLRKKFIADRHPYRGRWLLFTRRFLITDPKQDRTHLRQVISGLGIADFA